MQPFLTDDMIAAADARRAAFEAQDTLDIEAFDAAFPCPESGQATTSACGNGANQNRCQEALSTGSIMEPTD